jgi:hypothetical protein
MSGGDRNGLLGLDTSTGRAFDYCYGFNSPGYMKGPGK